VNLGVRVGAPSVREEAQRFSESSLQLIRANYGPALAEELDALGRESDPSLYREALLGLAQRQVQEGRTELAVQLYQELLNTSPANSPEATRARGGLDAILGRGAVGNRAEFLLRNFAQQSADPSTLLAMTAAGAVFRLTRLATLSRLAGETSPGFLTRLLGAGRLASLAGFAAEAPVFTLAGRLGSEALGRPQDWSGRSLGRDLASSYLVLGGLRFAGAVGRSLSERAGNPAVLGGLVQQGSMLSGILLGHRLETLIGLRASVNGATTLTDSLALLLQFHVAGNLTRSAFGPGFAAWETGLDLQSSALDRGPLLDFPTISQRPELATAGAAPTPRASRSRNPLDLPQVLMVIGGNGEGNNGSQGSVGSDPPSNGDGPRRRIDPDTTTSFKTARELKAEEGELPKGSRDPLQVESPAQLVRRIQDPELNFRESLHDGDMEFHVKPVPSTEAGPVSRIERYIPPILLHLNALSIGAAIPDGRRVIIVQEGTLERRYTLTKQNGRFECFPPLAETEPGEGITRPTPPRIASLASAEAPSEASPGEAETTPRSNPPTVENGVVEPKFNHEEEEARSIPLRTNMVETLPRVLALAARQSSRRGIPGLILLEQGALTLDTLERLPLEPGSDFSEGTSFKVFGVESQATFNGRVEAQGLKWQHLPDEKSWEPSTIFSNVTVRSVTEVYQILRAYSLSQISPNNPELVIRFRGPSPSRDALAEFIASTLDRFSPAGRESLRVEFDGGEAELRFQRLASGRWQPN